MLKQFVLVTLRRIVSLSSENNSLLSLTFSVDAPKLLINNMFVGPTGECLNYFQIANTEEIQEANPNEIQLVVHLKYVAVGRNTRRRGRDLWLFCWTHWQRWFFVAV